MEKILIDATNDSPAIQFESSGKLLIRGRSMPKKYDKFYNPLIEWVKLLNENTVVLDIWLEYMTSTSSKKLLELLKALDDNQNVRQYTVNWYYEAEDEDILERGRVFEELLTKAVFSFHEIIEQSVVE